MGLTSSSIVFLCLLICALADELSEIISKAEISLQLSLAAYCGKDKYTSYEFKSAADGFVVSIVVYDQSRDVEGFIGYLPSEQSLYIVFRGSESAENFLTDFDGLKDPYLDWPECNCEVHSGF